MSILRPRFGVQNSEESEIFVNIGASTHRKRAKVSLDDYSKKPWCETGLADVQFAGFWIRLWASLIDAILMAAWMIPALYYFYGDTLLTDPHLIMGPADFIISWVLPMLGVIVLWDRKQGTVGKLLLRLRIVDAQTLKPLSRRQEVLRYLGYFLSTLPLGLGFIWIAVDPQKQGLHDHLAGSLVIRIPRGPQFNK